MNLGENVGKLILGLALIGNDLEKCSVDVIFEQVVRNPSMHAFDGI